LPSLFATTLRVVSRRNNSVENSAKFGAITVPARASVPDGGQQRSERCNSRDFATILARPCSYRKCARIRRTSALGHSRPFDFHRESAVAPKANEFAMSL